LEENQFYISIGQKLYGKAWSFVLIRVVKGIEYIMCQSSFTISFSSLICHFSCDFFRLHIAYKQSVILTLLYHQKSVYFVYSLVNIFNTLIVIVKYFIYVCKLKNQIPVWKDCVIKHMFPNTVQCSVCYLGFPINTQWIFMSTFYISKVVS
jgi:hypothetical protein